MQPLDRRQRFAVALWLVVALVVWNGIYDLLLTRGVKEYLLRRMMHEAGRGPEVQLAFMMDMTVREAVWISTIWAGAILLAGLLTIRLLARSGDPHIAPPVDRPAH